MSVAVFNCYNFINRANSFCNLQVQPEMSFVEALYSLNYREIDERIPYFMWQKRMLVVTLI
jgi:hypothetical protein